MSGLLYGLGVGPGDPELITVKALRIFRRAQVVAYPAPEQGASFARGIVARWLSPAQLEIPIRIPIETARFPAQAVYDHAAAQLASQLEAGRDVAVICQGDPFFYGSFMYLFGRLAEHFTTIIVPGISSLTACAAAAGFPLAAREDVLAILPATLPEAVLASRLKEVDAAAIIKLGRNFAKLHDLLNRLGMAANSRYVEHATLGSERVLKLAEVGAAEPPYFSMILYHRRGEAWR